MPKQVQAQYNALRASQSADEASQWMKPSGNVDIDNKALSLLEQRYQSSKLNDIITEALETPVTPSKSSLLSRPSRPSV